MDHAKAVSILESAIEGSPIREDDPVILLFKLQKKRDALQAIDLRAQAWKMAARLHRVREEQHSQATRVKAIESLTQADVAAPLRALEDQIGIQRMKCRRLQQAAWRARHALDQAEQNL